MPRTPSQDRSRARVERILRAAAELLAETEAEKITARTLATRSGVSVGTIYQFFADVDAVRQGVAERTRDELQKVLDTEFTAELARASPGAFFTHLIDVIGDLQRRHPHIGCMVKPDHADGFRGAFASELRDYVAAHIHDAFSRAFVGLSKRALASRLKVIIAALLGALGATPPRQDPSRAEHLRQTKELIAHYANAAFVLNEQTGSISERAKRRQ